MSENRILSELQSRSPGIFNSRVKVLKCKQGDLISKIGQPIETVLFPGSAMVSLVTPFTDGSCIESVMVGHHGAIGASVLFGPKTHSFESFVQLPGTAWAVRAKDLIEIAEKDGTVAPIMFQAELLLFAEACQTAACNAKHSLQQRLATLLLRAHDVTGSSLFYLTQELISQMLGVQRATVTGAASQLQAQKLIQYRRGRIELLDLAGLEHEACECHADLRRARERIFDGLSERTGQLSQSRHIGGGASEARIASSKELLDRTNALLD